MGSIFDAIAYLDWIDRVEGLISSFLNADWKGSSRRAGLAGVIAELGRTISGGNRWRIYVPRDCSWSGAEIERFLESYGVNIWDRGFLGKDIYFSVKERQADWAEYLLLRRGIPLSGQLFNPQNAIYAQQYAPGDQPPAWGDRRERSRGWLDRFFDLFE
jgi:hypothetical protein